jgi:signal transduction histidine kinase
VRPPPTDASGDHCATAHIPGPSERHLQSISVLGASWLRAVLVGLCGVFGMLGHDGGGPAAVVVVLVAAAIAAMSCAQIRLRTISPTATVAGNLALAAVLGLSQVHLGAQPFSGWIVATASIMSVTCYFEWPDRPGAAHLIAGTTAACYALGCLLAGGGLPVLPAGRMVVQAALSFLGLLVVRRAARLYDAAARRLAQRRSAAAAVRAQRDADLAYMALLHDTASTTFLIVSTGATDDFDWLSTQARRDLEVLTTPWSSDQELDLAELLGTVTSYPGLTVRVDVPRPFAMPPRPALAIYHGVREALSNVREHADDPVAVVTAREHDGRVEVLVADRGRGFEPEEVPHHRRGLSHSIRARMVAAGGEVAIRSAPGQGTTVTWRWSRG